MTKKKPDFLRDLDTAIMDELTGGGIKGNAAGLVGTLTQIKEIKQLCGLPFCGYMAKLETVRPKAIQQLAGMVDSLKQCQTPQEVYDRYLQITGYCKCCVDCNFIDQKGADELMCLAAYLAGNEQARAEAQQKAGKKA